MNWTLLGSLKDLSIKPLGFGWFANSTFFSLRSIMYNCEPICNKIKRLLIFWTYRRIMIESIRNSVVWLKGLKYFPVCITTTRTTKLNSKRGINADSGCANRASARNILVLQLSVVPHRILTTALWLTSIACKNFMPLLFFVIWNYASRELYNLYSINDG